jgi:tRNA G18 (ribose-2'-O)-methylase SpoU
VLDASDPRLAPYRAVGDPAALARDGLFVAEGRLVVERLLEDGRFRVHSVAVTPSAAAVLAPLFERRPDVLVHVCEASVLRQITGFHFHRGCLALAYRPSQEMRLDGLSGARRILAVESVADPDNVGGLFRTASAFSIDAVVMNDRCADPLYRKAIRTSMAATLRVPFVRWTRWTDELEALRGAGFQLVALTPDPEAEPLAAYAARAAERVIVAVGSEGFGLSRESMALADARVRIPIDPRADSLNVVTAAAIALYALA